MKRRAEGVLHLRIVVSHAGRVVTNVARGCVDVLRRPDILERVRAGPRAFDQSPCAECTPVPEPAPAARSHSRPIALIPPLDLNHIVVPLASPTPIPPLSP